jgi:hypothetical protein
MLGKMRNSIFTSSRVNEKMRNSIFTSSREKEKMRNNRFTSNREENKNPLVIGCTHPSRMKKEKGLL